MIDQTITKRLEQVRQRAHAPYSQFKVGALVVDEKGRHHVGCNVENAAYPSGCCAEQSAVSQMVVNGGTQIQTIYIKGSSEIACPPCGQCRQIIAELGRPETEVIMLDAQDQATRCLLKDLLPSHFDPSYLATGKSEK